MLSVCLVPGMAGFLERMYRSVTPVPRGVAIMNCSALLCTISLLQSVKMITRLFSPADSTQMLSGLRDVRAVTHAAVNEWNCSATSCTENDSK